MKRFLSVFAVVLFLATPLYAAGNGEKTPFKYEEGRAAVRAYDGAVQKAVKEYAEAVQAAKKEYVAALDAALKTAMQRGDLDEANRLNAAKKDAERELAESLVAVPVLMPETTTEPLPTLVGMWRFEKNKTFIVCHPDGTYTRSWDRKAEPGTWRHIEGRKFMLSQDVIELSPDLNAFPNPNPKAKGQIIRRVLSADSVTETEPPK